MKENENKEEKSFCGCACEGCDKCANPAFTDLRIRLEFVNKSPNPDPAYKHKNDSCFDVRAWVDPELYDDISSFELENGVWQIRLRPNKRILIHTGLYFNIPQGAELQARTRSGHALEYEVVVLNSPGTIDQGYTGELGIILRNFGEEDYIIKTGDRVSQCGLYPVFNEPLVNLVRVAEIKVKTERGDGGFGHTGIE